MSNAIKSLQTSKEENHRLTEQLKNLNFSFLKLKEEKEIQSEQLNKSKNERLNLSAQVESLKILKNSRQNLNNQKTLFTQTESRELFLLSDSHHAIGSNSYHPRFLSADCPRSNNTNNQMGIKNEKILLKNF